MNNNLPAIQSNSDFMVSMPDNAPALGFDPFAPSFDWGDVLPDNYWNEENLTAKRDSLGNWPVFTPKYIVIKPVIDPEDKDPDLSPKIVMGFAETSTELVFNKSRCQMLTQITGTRNPARWVQWLRDNGTQVYLEWGVYNNRVQIVVNPIDEIPAVFDRTKNGNGVNVDNLNQELFG